jgi:hypothetical protein
MLGEAICLRSFLFFGMFNNLVFHSATTHVRNRYVQTAQSKPKQYVLRRSAHNIVHK